MEKRLTVQDYIASQTSEQKSLLETIRRTISSVDPDIEECISYGMPAFKYRGKPLVYFALCKHHIGFYPTPSGIEAFHRELTEFTTSKGAIHFPLTRDIPLDLIARITLFRLMEYSDKHVTL